MQASTAANTLIDFFLPRFCLSCNSKLGINQKVICNACLSSVRIADNSRLQFEYNKKFSSDNIIEDFASAYIFEASGSLQDLLHELKYKMRFRVGNFLGKLLFENIGDQINDWDVDCIIPMPLHKLKKAHRGYNQAEHIAKSFGKQLNIPVKNKLAKRIKFTQTQTKLNLAERKDNMKGAFKVVKDVRNKNILLLDDVITTGATVSELGRVLKENGASKVYACSVAIAD